VSSTDTRWGPGVNAEAIQAWDGPLFDRFVKFRHIVTTGLGAHGNEALRLNPPQEGQRVLDVGCGFGDTTQQIAALVGASGEAVGVDAATNFIDAATSEAAEAGVENARFFVADVQTDPLDGPYDAAFSRMGTMFFISPVAALRNVRQSLVPGGQLCMVVWRRREDNHWLYRAQEIVEEIVQKPEEYDEPTCGPGPFSMANADTVSEQLKIAGFEQVNLQRCDLPLKIGNDLDHAVEFNMALGPAGEVLRLWEDRIDDIRPKIAADLRETLAEFVGPEGVFAPASTWIIGATNPT
jgi:ubiquinone/menaquinone biosynthesis C-methylase UbiE